MTVSKTELISLLDDLGTVWKLYDQMGQTDHDPADLFDYTQRKGELAASFYHGAQDIAELPTEPVAPAGGEYRVKKGYGLDLTATDFGAILNRDAVTGMRNSAYLALEQVAADIDDLPLDELDYADHTTGQVTDRIYDAIDDTDIGAEWDEPKRVREAEFQAFADAFSDVSTLLKEGYTFGEKTGDRGTV